jgi:hypothetical protein
VPVRESRPGVETGGGSEGGLLSDRGDREEARRDVRAG